MRSPASRPQSPVGVLDGALPEIEVPEYVTALVSNPLRSAATVTPESSEEDDHER